METFLAKSDLRKLQLIHVIEESFQQQISISDLKTKMNMSEFIVISAYEELREDIKEFKLGKSLAIQKFNKIIKLKKALDFSTDVLKNNYIQKSLSFQIIQDLFNDHFVNPSEYANRYYISRTKVYSQVNELKEQFKKANIRLSSSFHLIGDELAIRMYFYNMYHSVFGVNSYPFSAAIKRNILDFIQQLEVKTNRHLSQTSVNKLLYFMGISYFRSELGKIYKNKLIQIQATDGEIIEGLIYKGYSFAFGRKLSKSETRLLGNFILTLDEFSEELTEGPLREKPADELTAYFVSEFTEHFTDKINPEQQEKLVEGLKKLHFGIINFKAFQTELDLPVEARFFNENYPEALSFCDDFIQKAVKVKKYQLIKLNDVYLYNQYILLLIDLLPPSFFSIPVKICVDFSLGGNYNKFIIRNIKSFDFLNIEVTNELSPDGDVDVLLGDCFIEGLDPRIEAIIWNAPPTAGDWANFGDCIAQIQKMKKEVG